MQVLNWVLGLCVCLLVASCGESEKERLSRLVSEWEGKEILFPTHSTFTIQGKDTVDFDFKDADYKVVKVAFIAAIAIVSGINVFNEKPEPMSDVVLANVEALAKGEGEGTGSGSSGYVECCGDKRLCTGNYCGLFLPAVGDNSIIMYHKY